MSKAPLPIRNPRAPSAARAAAARAEAAKADAARAAAESRATVARAEAEAARAKADSEARLAEAAARRAEIEAKAKKDAADAERAPYERAYQVGINLGMPVAGVVVGHKLAKGIEARHVATMTAANNELAKVASEAQKNLPKAQGKGSAAAVARTKLAASVAAADKLNLGKTRGPLGLATAGLLLGEGLLARFGIAPQIENQQAKEAVSAVATASVFAATTLVGDRALQNATPKALPSAKDVAAIEAARKTTAQAPAATAKAPPAKPASNVVSLAKAGRVVGSVAKLALPALAGAAAVATFSQSAKAGDDVGEAAGKAASAAGDVLTGGAVSQYSESLEKGDSIAMAGLRAAAKAVDSLLFFGLAQKAVDMHLAEKAAAQGKAYLDAAAEEKAGRAPAVAMQRPTQGARAPAARQIKSDGMTSGYTRRDGTVVSGYRTPGR